jgi:hypothetical protein
LNFLALAEAIEHSLMAAPEFPGVVGCALGIGVDLEGKG